MMRERGAHVDGADTAARAQVAEGGNTETTETTSFPRLAAGRRPLSRCVPKQPGGPGGTLAPTPVSPTDQ